MVLDIDLPPAAGYRFGQASCLITVALNGPANSERTGAYAPVAATSCMCAVRASADSQSAISSSTSASRPTPRR